LCRSRPPPDACSAASNQGFKPSRSDLGVVVEQDHSDRRGQRGGLDASAAEAEVDIPEDTEHGRHSRPLAQMGSVLATESFSTRCVSMGTLTGDVAAISNFNAASRRSTEAAPE